MSKKVTSFRLSEKALEQLKKLAEKENRSMANMVEELIRKEFQKLM
ncbi:ribbon-helix-helix protein, CopG family [Chryseobacterium manosquense]|uniref:Ribbon-helix-helix protein, CopG family n=1 Tax=Chryseobacterium manosquense TaxID=2754694 RepID=A0A7H1DT58_9FLAO|nr:ribbon-helix-helix protein, CopG family [Chryseobacterium manosquense]QNS40166.1 ribbon-helix-helix protein, CopG family [Chryseobacterium manosquense]